MYKYNLRMVYLYMIVGVFLNERLEQWGVLY